MTFTALSSAWLAALLVPLVAFYFLKLKRPRHDVSSLVLWRQVIADQRVNSPFQKFKRNLLLLLQILLLALLVLAAMQPLLKSGASPAERLPILIDASATGAGTDSGTDSTTTTGPPVHPLMIPLRANNRTICNLLSTCPVLPISASSSECHPDPTPNPRRTSVIPLSVERVSL